MQTQLISIDSQMSRITGEKLQLDNELRITKQQLARLKNPNADQQVIDQKNEKLAQKDKEIEAAENYLARLRGSATRTVIPSPNDGADNYSSEETAGRHSQGRCQQEIRMFVFCRPNPMFLKKRPRCRQTRSHYDG